MREAVIGLTPRRENFFGAFAEWTGDSIPEHCYSKYRLLNARGEGRLEIQTEDGGTKHKKPGLTRGRDIWRTSSSLEYGLVLGWV